MPDRWTVNGTETNGLEGSQSGLTPGETEDYTFLFKPDDPGTPPADEHIDRYEAVKDIVDVAGQFDVYESIGGVWYWREQTISSPLVHIEPPDNAPVAREVWGLVDSYSDETAHPETHCILTLSVLLIATGDDFVDEDALRTAREVTGP